MGINKQLTEKLLDAYALRTHESVVEFACQNLPRGYSVSSGQTWSLFRAPGKKRRPLFCIHTDTVWPIGDVNHNTLTVDDKWIISTDFKTGIGADDRNGIVVAMELMKKFGVACDYAFFDQEECGLVGSQAFCAEAEIAPSVIVGLDRKSSDEIALYGYENARMCRLIQKAFPGRQFAQGTISDCCVLASKLNIGCFNLSVGFYSEHTVFEYCDIMAVQSVIREVCAFPKAEIWHTVQRINAADFQRKFNGRRRTLVNFSQCSRVDMLSAR
jgi:hypothetical protein